MYGRILLEGDLPVNQMKCQNFEQDKKSDTCINDVFNEDTESRIMTINMKELRERHLCAKVEKDEKTGTYVLIEQLNRNVTIRYTGFPTEDHAYFFASQLPSEWDSINSAIEEAERAEILDKDLPF